MSNVWLTSDGLDIAFDEESTEELAKVFFDGLEGSFVSFETEGNKLKFQTGNIKGAFEHIATDTKKAKATITFGDFSYTIQWDHYNYKIVKGSNHSVFVTIEGV